MILASSTLKLKQRAFYGMFLRCCVGVGVAFGINASICGLAVGQSTDSSNAVKSAIRDVIDRSAPQFDDSDSKANLRALDALLLPAERPSVTWKANQHFKPPMGDSDLQNSGLAEIRVPAIQTKSQQSRQSITPFNPGQQEPGREVIVPLEDSIKQFNLSGEGGPSIADPSNPAGKFRETGGFLPPQNGSMAQPQQGGRRDVIRPPEFSLRGFSSLARPEEQDTESRQPQGTTVESLPAAMSSDEVAVPKASSSQQVEIPRREQVIENYDNGKPRIYRSVALDDKGNYVNDGPWRVVDRNGKTVAEGTYRQGVMHGEWGRRHVSSEGGLFATKPFTSYQGPFDSIAYFEQGMLDGQWVIYDSARRSVFEIGYRNGKRHGDAVWYFPDRTKMRTATFKDGVLDGEVREWDEDNRLVARDLYYDGRKVVRTTTNYRPNQKQSESYYLDSRLVPESLDNWWEAKPTPFVKTGDRVQNGPVKSWFPNQQPKYRGQYKNDLPIGQFFWWHENGNRKTVGTYDDEGRRTGRWTWWYANGMKNFEGAYRDGEPEGFWRSWFDDGQLRKERDYDAEKKQLDDSVFGFDGVGDAAETASGAGTGDPGDSPRSPTKDKTESTSEGQTGSGESVEELPIEPVEASGAGKQVEESASETGAIDLNGPGSGQ